MTYLFMILLVYHFYLLYLTSESRWWNRHKLKLHHNSDPLQLENLYSLTQKSLLRPFWIILSSAADIRMSSQFPFQRQAPFLLYCFFTLWDGRTYVLQIGAETFKCQRSPNLDLSHSIRMFRKDWEHLCSGRMCFSSSFIDCFVLEE